MLLTRVAKVSAARARFVRRQKERAELRSFRPQHQCRDHPSAVTDATRGHDWCIDRIDDLWNERERTRQGSFR
jgi:hypothetical protein